MNKYTSHRKLQSAGAYISAPLTMWIYVLFYKPGNWCYGKPLFLFNFIFFNPFFIHVLICSLSHSLTKRHFNYCCSKLTKACLAIQDGSCLVPPLSPAAKINNTGHGNILEFGSDLNSSSNTIDHGARAHPSLFYTLFYHIYYGCFLKIWSLAILPNKFLL